MPAQPSPPGPPGKKWFLKKPTNRKRVVVDSLISLDDFVATIETSDPNLQTMFGYVSMFVWNLNDSSFLRTSKSKPTCVGEAVFG